MTAAERKQHTEKFLETLGIHILDDLPPIEEEENVQLRTSKEIAERILILTYLNCIVTEKSLSEGVISFLKIEGLWEKATEKEKELFDKPQLTEEEETNILWHGESIWLLLWAINKVDELDLPVNEVDPLQVFERLPGFMKDPVDFVKSATVRPVSEILDQSDLIFRLNWAFRQAHLNGATEIALNESISYQRYLAINWVTCSRPQWEDDKSS